MNGQYVLEDNVTVILRCYDCKCSLAQSSGNVFGIGLTIIIGIGIALFIADIIFVSLYNKRVKAHDAFVVCCQSRRYLYFIVQCFYYSLSFSFLLFGKLSTTPCQTVNWTWSKWSIDSM